MSLDNLKGRMKEAAGKLTGDKRLQREGTIDRMSHKVKGAIDKVKNTLSGKSSR
jgi:uncharacterized protein YjbJ (UPF0337 family)